MSFTENKLELVITNLLKLRNIDHLNFVNSSKSREDVFFFFVFEQFIRNVYKNDSLTPQEVKNITIRLTKLPASDIYETNKIILDLVSNGFLLKREDRSKKDLYIRLIDYENIENNSFKFITQMEVQGNELRIPDGILYINGIPLIVFEFKSAIREDATIYDAYQQLTVRYARDIPELMKYNALCIISDGVNTKMGSLFASYEFFYAWRKVIGDETLEKSGIDSLHTMI